MNLLEQAKAEHCNIAIADIIYNPHEKSLYSLQGEIPLEPRNIALLEVLLSNVDNPTSIEEFIDAVWESQYISKNVVTNRISLLRNLFRQHTQQADSTKIIVTYPKRGYYIPQSFIQLIAKDQTISPNQASETPPATILKSKKLRYLGWSLSVLFASLTLLLAVHTWSHFSQQAKNNALHVPQVRLLLDNIVCEDEALSATALKLKALTLYAHSSSPFIHLSNMSSPSFYLHSLSEHCHFPGSDAEFDSDYRLRFNLWKDEHGNLNLESLLHLSASGRVAWRKIYRFKSHQLTEAVNQLNADLSDYFKLPQAIKTFSNHVSGLIIPVANTTLSDLLARPLTDVEVLFYTRELLFSNQTETDFKKWIAKVKERESTTPPDLHMLLALVTYRSGDVERSLRMLEREYAAEIPDNALIFLLQANINREKGNKQMFLAYYLKANSALTTTIPAERIFDLYSGSDRKKACLDLWQEALSDIKSIQKPKSVLWQGVETFCRPYP
ncbi:winged helix-turn-helix domain-containing protein [Vibrio hepatarius]|uniref:winged helix-turn-helix domain-containing protein n=1 Tax=Vibrio hepatarius TaxID=171383 RepID=UPI001C09FB9A|nr:winged helix-turn-helix domain-containing protein [Vibrio hepatarius]MBU2898481.1 winged helix-turn-helix domain-containing protein [Vibrio hepatarius]